MIQYIIKRILYFIPTLVIISLAIFFLSKSTPGDPLGDFIQLQESTNFGSENQKEKEYCNKYRVLNLDKPSFYFSLRPLPLDDEIREVCNYNKRQWFKTMSLNYGDYNKVKRYNQQLEDLIIRIQSIPDTISGKNKIARILNKLAFNTNPKRINLELIEVSKDINSIYSFDSLNIGISALRASFEELNINQNSLRKWMPGFHWYGLDCQYHLWVSKLIILDFGVSLKDGQKVFNNIWQAFKWTGLMVLMSFILTLFVGIPLGVFLASVNNSKKDKIISMVLYLLYAIPIFWLATLFVVFFTTNEYGSWTNLFPSILPLNFSRDDTFFVKFLASFKFLILPVICIALHSIAYIARLTRSSIIDQMELLYVRTARSKGISSRRIIWKHSFRNAMIPILSLLIAAIPASIAGSLVIEVIFNIPGMGRLMYESVYANDWPVLYGVVMLIGVFTVFIYLIGDIFYRVINPKITYSK